MSSGSGDSKPGTVGPRGQRIAKIILYSFEAYS